MCWVTSSTIPTVKVVLRIVAGEVVKDSLHHGRGKLLGAEAVTSADNINGVAAALLNQGGLYIKVQRFS
jgi:hypothetical protein